MALQSFANKSSVYLNPYPGSPFANNTLNFSTSALNAAGESIAGIGKLVLEDGSGSKTISSSGGKIHWRNGTSTFANAGTNLRIGIQDVGATGIEDGTFDVHADLVGGTDTLSTGIMSTAMETGSKTISHGDMIAVVFETTTRGGSDSVAVASLTSTLAFSLFPYTTIDTGSGPAKAANGPLFTIEFDDGTVGWFEDLYCIGTDNFNTINTGTTPDEVALIFQLPVTAKVLSFVMSLSSIASTDDFEVILYSNPLGTPVAERTTTIDASFTNNSNLLHDRFSSEYQCSANTPYAIAVRPITANSIVVNKMDFGAAQLLRPTALGTNWYFGSRSDQTGAFTPTLTSLPLIAIGISQFEDGYNARKPEFRGGLKPRPFAP